MALADGQGAGWAAAALAVSLVYLIAQLLVVVGGREPFLPGMAKDASRAGQIAVLVIYTAVSVFCVLGIVLAL